LQVQEKSSLFYQIGHGRAKILRNRDTGTEVARRLKIERSENFNKLYAIRNSQKSCIQYACFFPK